MREPSRFRLAVALNVFVGVMSLVAWLTMTSFPGEESVLASGGLGSLRFFTVLSNLLDGLICLANAWWLLRGKNIARFRRTLRLVGATAVGLTFVVVVAFLGPAMGYSAMYNGSNFWFHLVLPLASMGSFVLLEGGPRIPRRQRLWAVVPTVAYGLGYVLNIAANGMGAGPDSNDFYGFLSWGPLAGAAIALVLVLVTWLIATLLDRAADLVG